jgi:hypothetical protein
MTPRALLSRTPDELRSVGLSAAKTAALIDLAGKVSDGTVPLGELASLSDDEIVTKLVTVRGIGRWTSEMFLLFELRRPDVWPVDDLGVRNGYSLIHDLPSHDRAEGTAGGRRALPAVPQHSRSVLLAGGAPQPRHNANSLNSLSLAEVDARRVVQWPCPTVSDQTADVTTTADDDRCP